MEGFSFAALVGDALACGARLCKCVRRIGRRGRTCGEIMRVPRSVLALRLARRRRVAGEAKAGLIALVSGVLLGWGVVDQGCLVKVLSRVG